MAQTSLSGHRGAKATLQALRPCYVWTSLKDYVQNLIKDCIYCLYNQRRGRITRQFGPAFFSTKPNSLLQFDYFEIGSSAVSDTYICMLRDDHSSYCWVFSFTDTSAANTAIALIDWCSLFGVPSAFMADGSRHFKNETL